MLILSRVLFSFVLLLSSFDAAIAASAQTVCRAALTPESSFSVPYQVSEAGLIELKINIKNPILDQAIKKLVRALYRPLSIAGLEKVTGRLAADLREEVPFWIKLADAFGQKSSCDDSILQGIPAIGPLVIVANHPLNGVEGIAIAGLISRVRPDVKVALTPLLIGIPGMHENAIFVNPYGGSAATKANLIARDEMLVHLQSGGALLIFPSGEVSARENLCTACVTDGLWKTGIVKLLRQVRGAKVLPIFVEGQTGFGFQLSHRLASQFPKKFAALKMILKTVMHIREVASLVDEDVELLVGEPLAADELLMRGNDKEVIQLLRELTYGLTSI